MHSSAITRAVRLLWGLANLLSETRIPDIVGDLNTFGGNGMGAAVAQSSKVLAAIDYYDHANSYYERLKNHRAAPTTVATARRAAERAFVNMNQVLYARSFNFLNHHPSRMRQTTTVTGRPVWESIPVRNNIEVQRLASLARAGRVLGPGFILLDGGLRLHDVNRARLNGDPGWQRMALVEGGSFGMGIGAGVAIGLVVAATPVGLAIGIIAGGAAAVGLDHAFNRWLGRLYDWVTG